MRILVVEEEPQARSFLVQTFAAEGFSVDHLGDVTHALPHALTHSFDLVIMDFGRATAARLSVLPEFQAQLPELPVMVLSGSDHLATKLETFKMGVVDYMTKPFSIDELLARARVHLYRGKSVSRLQVGALTLDERSREAHTNGSVMSLSDLEFRVLRHLLLHAGEVVTRERLLSDVWGYDFDPGTNVVDVCVRRLRRKLGPDAPIETVRNAGYRIAVSRAELDAV
jgi:two-component system copper resistance phosphate regulon response regulator CusR